MVKTVAEWKEFYMSRVNSDRYYDYFVKRYAPFLDMIRNHGSNHIFEVGCGIGTVSKVLAKDGFTYSGIDLCPNMAEYANLNTNSNMFEQGDMFKFSTKELSVTHGVLEHFEDELIVKSVELYPNSIHYVPLDKYVTPSFGDERLLPYQHWIELLSPTEWELFNDGHDLAFKI